MLRWGVKISERSQHIFTDNALLECKNQRSVFLHSKGHHFLPSDTLAGWVCLILIRKAAQSRRLHY